MRYCKYYELRSSPKPTKRKDLLSTVAIEAGGEKFYCYISFSDRFVQALGRLMPLGVSELNPVFLSIYRSEQNGVWGVSAQYVNGGKPVFLWGFAEPPEWVRFIKVSQRKRGKDGDKAEIHTNPGSDEEAARG